MLVDYSNIDAEKITGPWTGKNNFSGDPELDKDSLHIREDSPCFNMGTETVTYNEFTFDFPQNDIDGEFRPVLGNVDVGADEYFVVGITQNNRNEEISFEVYPNPFKTRTIVSIDLDHSQRVKLEAYDSRGMKVETITDRYFEAGKQFLEWNADHLPEGIYFLRYEGQSRIITAKAIHLK